MKTNAISFKGLETTTRGVDVSNKTTSAQEDLAKIAKIKSVKPQEVKSASINQAVGNDYVRIETNAGDVIMCDKRSFSTSRASNGEVTKYMISRSNPKQESSIRHELALLHANLVETASEYLRKVKK